MNAELKTFINALNRARMKHFVPRVLVEPQLKPAYKKITIEIYEVKGGKNTLYATTEGIYMITTEEQKERALAEATEDIIVKVLKIPYETI